jgi:hypothetical protein
MKPSKPRKVKLSTLGHAPKFSYPLAYLAITVKQYQQKVDSYEMISILLISLVCSSCYARQDSPVKCPPWFFYNTATNTCECYSSPRTDRIVKCTEKGALLKLGYCMTYEEESGFHVGVCTNVEVDSLNITMDNYIRLPNNISDLNDYMCGPMNRQDPMCSQCDDGFGLAVFLSDMCALSIKCTGVWYGIPLYLFIEFIPITVATTFYFIAMFKSYFSRDGGLCLLQSNYGFVVLDYH